MKKLTNKKGFTLVELLVVVAIIAILMLIAIPRFMNSTTGAKIKTFEGNFRTVVSAITQYTANNAGSTDQIDAATSDVQKLVGTLAGKPAKAEYKLEAAAFTATLPAGELGTAAGGGDYKIVYNLTGANAGTITQENPPAGAANLKN